MVLLAAEICEEKKATDTRILELDPADAGFTDFFLITSCSNTRQTGAVADEIELRMKRQYGTYAKSVEGRRTGEWILLDYIDFVVHIFTEETREFYDIERLRKSARTLGTAELSAALKQKTADVRKKAPATLVLAPAGDLAVAKKAAKKAAKKSAGLVKTEPPAKKAAKKSALKKAPARKAPAKQVELEPVAAKKAAKKAPAKKAPAKKAPAKKAPAKKAPAKKAPAKKAPAKTSLAKKAAGASVLAARGPAFEDTSRKALPAGSPAKGTKRLAAPKK
jgi:ribosome-associated protein